ncbi:RNA polymerase sigma factor [Phytohabitans flavus]|uniref:RNA polymerase sigma factor n=1 Tax=Phytohabitans flavus TaxID=1076124 RepID=UPI00156328AE|nr:RNA polymerase sigma factor [Phytohabitans flavus]
MASTGMTTPTSPVAIDPADLAGVFDRYARDLLRYCTRRVGEQVAEDVVAETFLVAYEQRDRYDASRGEVLPWLYGIATNLLRRHRRTEIRALRALAHVDGDRGWRRDQHSAPPSGWTPSGRWNGSPPYSRNCQGGSAMC